MNNKEKVIQLLINEFNNSNSNPIKIDRNDISVLQIPEKEIIKILNTLHEDGLIIAKPRSPHKDFSLYWEITIKTECLEYFNNKKHAKTTNRRDWVENLCTYYIICCFDYYINNCLNYRCIAIIS